MPQQVVQQRDFWPFRFVILQYSRQKSHINNLKIISHPRIAIATLYFLISYALKIFYSRQCSTVCQLDFQVRQTWNSILPKREKPYEQWQLYRPLTHFNEQSSQFCLTTVVKPDSTSQPVIEVYFMCSQLQFYQISVKQLHTVQITYNLTFTRV